MSEDFIEDFSAHTDVKLKIVTVVGQTVMMDNRPADAETLLDSTDTCSEVESDPVLCNTEDNIVSDETELAGQGTDVGLATEDGQGTADRRVLFDLDKTQVRVIDRYVAPSKLLKPAQLDQVDSTLGQQDSTHPGPTDLLDRQDQLTDRLDDTVSDETSQPIISLTGPPKPPALRRCLKDKTTCHDVADFNQCKKCIATMMASMSFV